MSDVSKKSRSLRPLFDAIEEVASILVVLALLAYAWLVDSEVVQNVPVLWGSVILVLTLIAVSSLRDRLYRFRRIQDTVEQTYQAIRDRTVLQLAGADEFFSEGRQILDDEALIAAASSIAICGITLTGTVARLLDPLKDRLKAGAQIRIMMLDATCDDALKQLVKRSWSKAAKEETYGALLTNNADLLQDLENVAGASGSLEVGVLPFIPSLGITIIDEGRDNGAALVEVYHQLRRQSPSFKVIATKDPVSFQQYCEQFELMWRECRIKRIV